MALPKADEPLRLRNTLLAFYADCPEKFRIAYFKQLQTKERPQYFDDGSLYHEGLRNYLHPINQSLTLADRLEVATRSIKQMTEELDTTPNTALGLLEAYFRKYPEEDEFRVISVEQQLSIKLVPNATYGVTCDAIGETRSKRLATIEHKSTSGYGPGLSRSIKHSPQVAGQAYVAREVLRRPVEMAIINYGVKTKVPRAERDKVLINDHMLDFWHKCVMRRVVEIQQTIERLGIDAPWPQNDYQCYTIRGECPYAKLCHFGWTKMVLAGYVEQPVGGPKQTLR